MAKLKWKSGPYVESAINTLKKEPKLPIKIAARNLWNLFALDYKSEEALLMFTDVYLRAKPEDLNELDIANALRAFAHF